MSRFHSALIALAALAALALCVVLALFVASRGTPEVAATVIDDASLPAMDIDGIRLHAETMGEAGAPVIIALHGGPGGDYAGLLPLAALADHYFVVFYDQRGAGLSQRVGVEALTLDGYLAELDAIARATSPGAPVILIGHSWGAMLASAYIAAHPERVTRAVLIEPGFLTAREYTEWQSRADDFLSGWAFLKAAIWNGFRAAHVAGPDDAAADDFLIGEMVAGFANHPDNPYHCPGRPFAMPAWRFGAAASKAARSTPPDAFARLVATPPAATPVLLIAGACDDWLGAPLQRRHLALFADARLAIIPEAGHAVLSDNPVATLSEISRFLSN